MSIQAWMVWGVLALIMLMFEMGHPGLFLFLSFSVGALIAGLAASANYGLASQLTIFSLGVCTGLLLFYRWLKAKGRGFHKAQMGTNAYALVGKEAKAVSNITAQSPGQVIINGEIWRAKTYGDATIFQGDQVIVLDIKGCHLIVQIKNLKPERVEQ